MSVGEQQPDRRSGPAGRHDLLEGRSGGARIASLERGDSAPDDPFGLGVRQGHGPS
jgi:hypothetical protein